MISLKNRAKKVHIIGIGGAGMSAIALILNELGYDVSGSDLKKSRYVEFVESKGIPTFIGHSPENVLGKDLVIYSTAIPPNNPEIGKARELGIRVIHRSEALQLIADEKKVIAVTGTHGKTTTTSLAAHILRVSGLDAGFIVGGEVNDYGSNAMYGKGEYFVIEADESDGTFLKIKPYCSIFTNLEPEHLDFFESEQNLISAALTFIENTENVSVLCYDDKRLRSISRIANSSNKIITYGFSGGDVVIRKFVEKPDGIEFSIQTGHNIEMDFSLPLRGKHNALNATAVISLMLYLGIPQKKIKEGLKNFKGVGRRLQLLSSHNGIAIFDDYAHHPTEISAVLQSLRGSGFKRIIAVFQPHRYSRTYHLLSEFPKAFSASDYVITTEVYSAGEEPIPGITGKILFEAIAEKNTHKKLAYLPRLIDIPSYIKRIARNGDAVVFLGAGDITLAAKETARLFEEM
ncbi:MAG: UDP-N-acetylmuramate--L-alanine ligase [Actinobacteria bacterium]|nr:UDP-N-acetylmuramate--L-alanine ligase [Actinomycetota bacterium]